MEITWIVELLKSQGLSMGIATVLFIVLMKLFSRLISDSKNRERTMQDIITNHLNEHSKVLLLINESLKQTNQEHQEMIKQLVRLNERVK